MSKATDIKQKVRQAYGKIALKGTGSCCGSSSTCSPQAKTIALGVGYTEEALKGSPEGANLGLGCGNPTALAGLRPGDTVVDLGSGAGLDCFIASPVVGHTGRVIGVDMTEPMVERARKNAAAGGYTNVEFVLGEIEALPVVDSVADVVISNCVVNLSADKPRVFGEIYRVLKSGGRIALSDIALRRPLPEVVRKSVEAYVGCVSGALLLEEYKGGLEAAGFRDVRMTVKGVSACIDVNTLDPLVREILDKLDNPAEVMDSVVSVYVEARKP